MESMRASDNREQFDQAANALMASLRKSRDLNIEIRQALLLGGRSDLSLGPQTDAARFVESPSGSKS